MRFNLKKKYFTAFISAFIPIFIIFNIIIYSYMKDKLFNEKWNSMATLAENSALISEEYVVGEEIDLLSLQQILTNISKNEGVIETYILNKKNELIAHQNIEMLNKKDTINRGLSEKNLIVDRKKSGVFSYKNNYLVSAPIYKSNTKKTIGTLEIIFSKKNIITVINKILYRTVFLSALGIIVISLIILFMVNLIIKPIKRLHEGVEEISSGNYDTRVKKTTSDEVGDLTQSFNRMAKNLKEKELVKNMFSKYLSPDIADYILNNPEEVKLGGENRELTIMFADIRSFTSLSENFPPQDIVNLLNSFFTSMVDIIFEYKGTLDKFLGDGLLAIFGAPVKYPNHAYNSVKAAVNMVNYIKEYNKKRKKWGYEPIHIGIGLNTGEAIIGNIGSKQRAEYTVIGDTVNTCSRIEGLTGKNEVYISQSTFELVKNDIIYEYIGKKKVKNKKYPIDIYKVVDIK